MNEIDVNARAETIRAETEAITKIAEALSPLTSEGTQRVLRYINQTYQSKGTVHATVEKAFSETEENQPQFSEFHELFDAARPETGAERALVVGYWLQVLQGNEEWDSFFVNKELKLLGWPASNITRDIDVLMKRTPRWVHQTRKEGTSQQARKNYKLTNEGIRAVQRMLASNRTSTNVESDSIS
jgi:hypothetical protein